MPRADRKVAAKPSSRIVREMTVQSGWSMTRVGDGWRIRQPDAHCFVVPTNEDTPVSRFFREVGPWLAAMLDEDRQLPQGRMSDELRAFIEGMSVSVDVSTGEEDSENRYFGVVSEVMDDAKDKHGVTLLVYNATPNFKPCTCGGPQQQKNGKASHAKRTA